MSDEVAVVETAQLDDRDQIVEAIQPDGEVSVRSESRREIDARLLTWDTVVDTPIGLEMFRKGSFRKVDPKKVVLLLGHDGDPAGRGLSLEEREDGPYMTFRVSQTQRGDELLTLARDGVTPHVSVGYRPGKSKAEAQYSAGRRVTAVIETDLDHVATTYKPAYQSADIVAIRERTEGDAPVATPTEIQETDTEPTEQQEQETPVPTPAITPDQTRANEASLRILDRLEGLETRARQEIIVPASAPERDPKGQTGQWMKLALALMTGDRVSDIQMRSMADLITSDNVGIVPNTISSELVGIIDPYQPFLQTTRELPTPESGLTLTVPVLVTRPTVGIQSAEKDDITSTTTSVTTTGFDAVTVAGGGDISLQLLKRSSPSYLDLYLSLLAEAYSFEADSLAVATLLDSGVTPGTGYIDPEDLTIGEAWTNAVSVSRLLRPDHMWMSTQAIQAFIDAKATTTNAPLYSNLAADITVGNGAQGRISGLIPVYVPALDGSGADVLIGPSRGFAWAEDGTYTLQVDVPSKAGRDVALVSILWFAPLYPAAFTSYRLAS